MKPVSTAFYSLYLERLASKPHKKGPDYTGTMQITTYYPSRLSPIQAVLLQLYSLQLAAPEGQRHHFILSDFPVIGKVLLLAGTCLSLLVGSVLGALNYPYNCYSMNVINGCVVT